MTVDPGYDHAIEGGYNTILLDGDAVLESGRAPRGAVRVGYDLSNDDAPAFLKFTHNLRGDAYSIVQDTDLDGVWDLFIDVQRQDTGEKRLDGNEQIGHAEVPVYGSARTESDISDLNLAVPAVEWRAHHDDYVDLHSEVLGQVANIIVPDIQGWNNEAPVVEVHDTEPGRQEITVVQHIDRVDEENVLWSREFVLDFESESLQDIHDKLDEITNFLADPDVSLIS